MVQSTVGPVSRRRLMACKPFCKDLLLSCALSVRRAGVSLSRCTCFVLTL